MSKGIQGIYACVGLMHMFVCGLKSKKIEPQIQMKRLQLHSVSTGLSITMPRGSFTCTGTSSMECVLVYFMFTFLSLFTCISFKNNPCETWKRF